MTTLLVVVGLAAMFASHVLSLFALSRGEITLKHALRLTGINWLVLTLIVVLLTRENHQ